MNASIESLSQNNLCEVSTRDMLIGMYVAELDCAWSATPFPPGGFHLKKADDIATLAKFCRTVQIDLHKGAGPKLHKEKQLTILSSARKASPQAVDLKVKRDAYPVSQTVKQLIDSSATAYEGLSVQFTELSGRVRAGQDLRLTDLDKSLDACLDSIIANPQAMVWLLNTDSFPVVGGRYCVRAAIWATMLARQFGLPRTELRAVMLGTLLCDIGLNLLPERLVNKRGCFRKKEFLAYRKHVEFGLELLGQQPGLDDRVPRIVRCHHERNDGRGFPRNLKGEQISALARFAHLAYCFERYLRSAAADRFMSPATAIARLYKQRDLKFPEQLIVEFIHLLGMYPLGSLETLSNEQTAVVLEQHAAERMNPKDAVLLDAQGVAVEKPRIIDLSVDAAECTISNSQPPGYRNLNAKQYRFAFFGKRVALGPLSFRF